MIIIKSFLKKVTKKVVSEVKNAYLYISRKGKALEQYYKIIKRESYEKCI
jgi:hypothetical protein